MSVGGLLAGGRRASPLSVQQTSPIFFDCQYSRPHLFTRLKYRYMERFNRQIGWEQLCLKCNSTSTTNQESQSKMRLDAIHSLYVCMNCGWAVKSQCTAIYEKFGNKSGRWLRGNSYNRKSQFTNRIERKRCISNHIQSILTYKFIDINNFYTHELVGKTVFRKNILKYEYLIHKMLQCCRRHDLAARFSCPKTNRKIIEYERVWKLICNHFDWVFYDNILKCKLNKAIMIHDSKFAGSLGEKSTPSLKGILKMGRHSNKCVDWKVGCDPVKTNKSISLNRCLLVQSLE